MKSILTSYVFPVVLAFVVAYGCKKAETPKMQICKHRYALCTSAPCVPMPGDPSKAICSCDVHEGDSMATTDCGKLQPSVDENGLQTVYSTFSFAQYGEGKMGMKCPDGTPWTWCLNKRCTVDPADPMTALCVCDVVRKGKWLTLGGDCDTSTCKTGYWSGATLSAFGEGNEYLKKAMDLKENPVKWCPAQ